VKAESFYNLVFLGACFALYYVDTPKAMAISALVGACSFVMAALAIQEKHNQKIWASIERLREREDPMRDIDDA
jgi:hypothetical protein